METGDGRTEDSGGLPRTEENVIRLPRDWLGPPEELVPIGPAARARAAQRDAEAGLPPTADAFWSEDSAALHDAVQAPAGIDRLEPPAGLVPPVAGLRAPCLGRVPRLRLAGRGSRVSRWWGLLSVPLAALLVVAVIGSTEGPVAHPMAGHALSSRSLGAVPMTSSPESVSSDAGAERFRAQLKERQQRTTGGARTHSRARGVRPANHPAKPHHRAPAHHPTASPAATVTEAAAPPPTSESRAPAVTPTTPTASTASTSSSGGSKRATGPAGPIGIGSVSGGNCNPKCS